MSKKPTKTPVKNSTEKPASNGDGYKTLEDRVELAGYWDAERGPIHGKLVDAFKYIQKSGKGRGQERTMFVIDLLEACPARVRTDKGLEDSELEPRELCGVMGSVGLRNLATLGGCFVRIEREGKKTLGNGNEMWHYHISYKGRPSTLDVRAAFAAHPDREPGDDSDEADALPF